MLFFALQFRKIEQKSSWGNTKPIMSTQFYKILFLRSISRLCDDEIYMKILHGFK